MWIRTEPSIKSSDVDLISFTEAPLWKKRYPRSPLPLNSPLLQKRQNPNRPFPQSLSTMPQSSPKTLLTMSHCLDPTITRSILMTPSLPRLGKSTPCPQKNERPPRTSSKRTSTVERSAPQIPPKRPHSSLLKTKMAASVPVRTTVI